MFFPLIIYETVGLLSIGRVGLNILGCMNLGCTDFTNLIKSSGGLHCLLKPKSKGKLYPISLGAEY